MPNNTENTLTGSGMIGGTIVNRTEYPDLAQTVTDLGVVYTSPPSGWVAFDEAVDMANDPNGAIYRALSAREATRRAEEEAQASLWATYGSMYGGSTTVDRRGLTVSDRMGNTRVQMGSSISARSGGASGGSTSRAGYGSFQLSQAARDAAENHLHQHLMEQFHSSRIRNVDDEFERIYEQERELQLRRGLENALRTPREVEIITDDTFASTSNTGTAYITNANVSSRMASIQSAFSRGFS